MSGKGDEGGGKENVYIIPGLIKVYCIPYTLLNNVSLLKTEEIIISIYKPSVTTLEIPLYWPLFL